jgi:hypothetical protein
MQQRGGIDFGKLGSREEGGQKVVLCSDGEITPGHAIRRKMIYGHERDKMADGGSRSRCGRSDFCGGHKIRIQHEKCLLLVVILKPHFVSVFLKKVC